MLSPQRLDRAHLIGRQQPGAHLGQSHLGGDVGRGRGVIASEHDQRPQPQLPQLGQGGGAVVARRVGQGDVAAVVAVVADEHGRLAAGVGGADGATVGQMVDVVVEPGVAADLDPAAVNPAADATAAVGRHAGRRRVAPGHATRLGFGHHGAGQGVLAAALDGRGQGEQVVAGRTGRNHRFHRFHRLKNS